MVMQERIFFRNIPLSNWIEREMLLEEGSDQAQLPMQPVFTTTSLPTAEPSMGIARLLDEVNAARPEGRPGLSHVPPQVLPQAPPRELRHEMRTEIHPKKRPEVPAEVHAEVIPAHVHLTQHATAFGAQ